MSPPKLRRDIKERFACAGGFTKTYSPQVSSTHPQDILQLLSTLTDDPETTKGSQLTSSSGKTPEASRAQGVHPNPS